MTPPMHEAFDDRAANITDGHGGSNQEQTTTNVLDRAERWSFGRLGGHMAFERRLALNGSPGLTGTPSVVCCARFPGFHALLRVAAALDLGIEVARNFRRIVERSRARYLVGVDGVGRAI